MAKKPHKNHIISRRKYREFLESHPEHRRAKVTFDSWYKTVLRARWETFADVRETYGDVSLVGKFIVFNVGGNKYRIVAEFNYRKNRLLIRHALTHSEYDQDKWKS